MQYNQENQGKSSARPRLGRTRFVGLDPTRQTTDSLPITGNLDDEGAEQPALTTQKKAIFPSRKSTRLPAVSSPLQKNSSLDNLTQLSGMMRPIRKPGTTRVLSQQTAVEDGYWPLGIQQIGPLAIVNLYGREPFGRTLPTSVPLVMPDDAAEARTREQPFWQKIPAEPIFKISLGVLVGLVLLALIFFRFINLSQTLQLLATHLTTFQGIGLALLAGIAYLASNVLRGVRWKFLLDPIGQASFLQTIGLYQVATFLNFLLPLRAGEAARSLALKRIAHIPISQSLPTIAMDKSLDLLSVLIVIALVPVLSISMDLALWLVFSLAVLLLLATAILLGLALWRRASALAILQKFFWFLPKNLGLKIEGFVTGFVDGLLSGAKNPKSFLLALLLTACAIVCEGLFALLAFRATGASTPFGIALFGYAVYKLCSVLPTPPGQLGSNEAIGLLIFGGLLHLVNEQVIAMYLFAHLWSALLLTAAGLGFLRKLNLTVTNAMRVPEEAARETTGPLPSGVN